MTTVEEAIAEIDAALAAMALPHEGLTDLRGVDDLKPESQTALDGAIQQYDRRKTRLEAAKTQLEQLLADGYPVLVIPPVTVTVAEDLAANVASMAAALSKIGTDPATELNATAAPPEPT